MRKICISLLFLILLLLSPQSSFALNDCALSISYSPYPLYYDFDGNINFTISGTQLVDGARHKIKIVCSSIVTPDSNVSTVSNQELNVTISPNSLERTCLRDSYRTGAKNVVLLTEGGGEICQFTNAFRTEYRETCSLSANPPIVNPGEQVTFSGTAPSGTHSFKIYNSQGGFIQGWPASGGPFQKTINAPSQEDTYTGSLRSFDGTRETILCSADFKVQMGEPEPGPSPGEEIADPCWDPEKKEAIPVCVACLGGSSGYDSNRPNLATKSWTALGCIPNDPRDFVAWLLARAIGIGGGIAFLLMIWGGFQVITAAGDPDRLNAGKEIITSAIAGLLLIIFSLFLLELIGVDILGLKEVGFKFGGG